jgi:hypothetical protein
MNKSDISNLNEKSLMDLYLLCKEELEKRSERRKSALGLLENDMLIEEAENMIGSFYYEMFLREGLIYEVGDKVRLL